jgi:tetratricopeptide (TPR) repeat protein
VAAPKPAPAPKPVAAEKPAPVEKPAPAPARRTVAAADAGDQKRRAQEAYLRGNAKLFEGRAPDAIAAFKEALKLDPQNAAAHRGLGLAYAQSGNAGQAVQSFKRYLKVAPTAPDRALIEKRIAQLSR